MTAHQSLLLEMLKDIDTVCRKHRISYQLFAGTALGAVRHHGFIPWDDDADIIMPRREYTRFFQEAAGDFDEALYFVQQEHSAHWPMPYSKLRRNNTTCIEKFHPKDRSTHQGVYVDIFPCDNLSDCALIRRAQFIASKIVIAKGLYADVAAGAPVEYDSIYRMMSMTKPVTAVGILKLMDRGLITLDDPLSKFLPQFKDMQVCADKRYEFKPGMNMLSLLQKLLFFRMDRVKTVPADREITIRDLLSHSSGLAQGVVGLIAMMKDKSVRESLSQQADVFGNYVLDFQPGTGTGYSPLALSLIHI